MKRRAVVTGITGQDGSYLAELLLEKGYEVHGVVRDTPGENPAHLEGRIAHIVSRIQLHPACIENHESVHKVIREVKPDECYHLAGVTMISYRFEDEFSTMRTNVDATHHLLSALLEYSRECRFFLAGSSELFGRSAITPQSEATPMRPRGAYGISKQAAFELTRMYREMHQMHTSCGFLFNHESPRRGLAFVPRKITRHAAMIKLGLANEVALGSLDARRDWGHARDVVRAMWMMLQQPAGDDYVIATGKLHSVRDLCQMAFEHVGLDYRDYVKVDPKFVRPPEATVLQGDASKAKRQLGWEPTISFRELVGDMVEHDLRELQREAAKKKEMGTPRPEAAVKTEVQVFVTPPASQPVVSKARQ